MARPKLDDETERMILLAVRAGAPMEVAAQYAGIGASTFWQWLRVGTDLAEGKPPPDDRFQEKDQQERLVNFAERVRRAEAEAHVYVVGQIREWVPKDPKAAVAWAKMRWAKHYAERTEITGADGGPIQVDAESTIERLTGLLGRYAPAEGTAGDPPEPEPG